jgi:putative transposase
MRAHQGQFKVSRMCDVFEISRSGYYSWRIAKRPNVLRRTERYWLRSTRYTCGANKPMGRSRSGGSSSRRALIECGRNQVARLRREAGIEARRRRRFRITTQSRIGIVPAENKLNRSFEVDSTNRAWVGDINVYCHSSGMVILSGAVGFVQSLMPSLGVVEREIPTRQETATAAVVGWQAWLRLVICQRQFQISRSCTLARSPR